MVKNPLSLLWNDRCTVTTHSLVKNPETNITKAETVTLYEEIPCKLSFERLASAGEGLTAAVAQGVRLFLPLEAAVPAGAAVAVTRPDGTVLRFRRAGEAGVFSRHREVLLESERERA